MGYLNVSHLKAPFKAVVDGLAITVRSKNKSWGKPLGPIKRVIMHWSVEPYTMCFDAYHYCIVFDKATKKAHVVKTLKLSQLGEHAYKYNTGSVGVSFMGEMNGQPVTPEQIAEGAKFVAEFCAWHNLDPRTDDLMDHWRADRIIGRNQKVDIRRIWNEFHAAVLAHYAALKSGKAQFQYRGILTD